MLRFESGVPEESDSANAVGIVIGDQPIKNKGINRAANGLRFADILVTVFRLHAVGEFVAFCRDALNQSGCPSPRRYHVSTALLWSLRRKPADGATLTHYVAACACKSL